jgi:hypothetical protein
MALGAYPINPGTPVGLFRTMIGDDTATDITGTAPNQTAEYEFFSDDAIQAYLDSADTPELAMSNALRTMGRKLLLQAQDIQVDDIRIKTVERANIFMAHADSMGATQDSIDADTAFSVVPLNVGVGYARRPQGTPYPWGAVG